MTVLKDLPDNRILECAIAAQAEVIVSGDPHLLDLKQYEGIPVLRLHRQHLPLAAMFSVA